MKLLVDEEFSIDLARTIDAWDVTLLGTRLLETELRRAAHRQPLITQDAVTRLLSRFDLYALTDAVYRTAGLLPESPVTDPFHKRLRSLDAIHIAAALALGADKLCTYDHRQAVESYRAGVDVIRPSSSEDYWAATPEGDGHR